MCPCGMVTEDTGVSEPTSPASPSVHWKKRRKISPIPPDQARRQGAITTTAYLILGREAAIVFLNTAHSKLGGRPIDVAMDSDEGRIRVEAEIGRIAYQA